MPARLPALRLTMPNRPHAVPSARSLFRRVREETALESPTLTVEYLQGSNALLAAACGRTDTAELACT